MAEKNTFYRLPLMILALFSLTFAVWAGLVRLGWPWPAYGGGFYRSFARWHE